MTSWLLLMLQNSFLIPPMGYAVLMVRSRGGLGATSSSSIVKSLLPFILVQLAVTVCVFAFPPMVHWLDAPKPATSSQPATSDEDIVKQMREMSGSPTSDGEK